MIGNFTFIARRVLPLAIVCLIVVGPILLSRQSRGVFVLPSYWLLAIFSCVLVIPWKARSVTTLQKVLAAYLMAMGVDYTSGVYWPLGADLQVAASLCVTAVAVLAAWLAPRHETDNVDSKEPAIAIVVAGGIIVLFLLAMGLLMNRWYGYGTERSLAVCGQLAMTLLTAVAAWRLSGNTACRIALGIAGIAAYSWMVFSS